MEVFDPGQVPDLLYPVQADPDVGVILDALRRIAATGQIARSRCRRHMATDRRRR